MRSRPSASDSISSRGISKTTAGKSSPVFRTYGEILVPTIAETPESVDKSVNVSVAKLIYHHAFPSTPSMSRIETLPLGLLEATSIAIDRASTNSF